MGVPASLPHACYPPVNPQTPVARSKRRAGGLRGPAASQPGRGGGGDRRPGIGPRALGPCRPAAVGGGPSPPLPRLPLPLPPQGRVVPLGEPHPGLAFTRALLQDPDQPLVLNWENDDYRWVAPEELRRLDCVPQLADTYERRALPCCPTPAPPLQQWGGPRLLLKLGRGARGAALGIGNGLPTRRCARCRVAVRPGLGVWLDRLAADRSHGAAELAHWALDAIAEEAGSPGDFGLEQLRNTCFLLATARRVTAGHLWGQTGGLPETAPFSSMHGRCTLDEPGPLLLPSSSASSLCRPAMSPIATVACSVAAEVAAASPERPIREVVAEVVQDHQRRLAGALASTVDQAAAYLVRARIL